MRALALDKARRVAERRPDAVVIGADTVVVARGVRLGKPENESRRLAMLRRLQGRTHEVWTGIAVVRGDEQRTAAECTRVTFARLGPPEIAALRRHRRVARQGRRLRHPGRGGAVRDAASKATTNVVGLPLARLRRLLAEFV